MRFIFFSASPEHRKTLGRTEGLAALGVETPVAGYTRPTESDAAHRSVFHSLGHVRHGARLSRLIAFPLFAWRAARFAARQGRCDCLWANTLDTLVLALVARPFCKGAPRIVYDVADLTSAQLDPGPKGAIMRWVESVACRFIDIIVMTSPWFYWRYYRDLLPARVRAYLLENKLSPPLPSTPPRPTGPPWRIVWHGRLRSPSSLAIARALAEALPTQIELRAFGHADGAMLEALQAAAAALPNFSYHGAYSDKAIDTVFEGAHFLFAYDLDDGENSRLLLPNRLYHGVARAIPLLAAADTAVGKVVDGFGVGRVFAPPYADAMIAWLGALDRAGYEALTVPFTERLREGAIYSDDLEQVVAAIRSGETGRAIPPQERFDVALSHS